MFSAGSNSAQDGSGSGRSLLVPVRFVWRDGGNRVSLIGSFTRWAEYIHMTPVEGSTTVFQTMVALSPGYHEYKFYVDGNWQHDERQPYVAGDYGIVNTIFLDTLAIMNNMEVDYIGISQSSPAMQVAVPGNMMREAIPRISETDTVASRHSILSFLSTRTAYDLMPDSGKVIMLDVNLPVKQAFHILYEQGIPIAPLWNSRRLQFVGMLSALDFILILRDLGHAVSLTEEELETHSISAWKEGKRMPIDGHAALHKHFIQAGPFDLLKDVVMKIMQNGISTVPIIQGDDDGSVPQLLHLASLCEVLKCICRHFRHSSNSLPILQQPVSMFPLGTRVPDIGQTSGRPLHMLKQNASMADALALLVEAQVSSVPIVDDNDALLDIFSRSDITALAKDRAYAHVRLDQMSIQQALQLRQDASAPLGLLHEQRCQMCLRSDSLWKVMERLSIPGVRRIIIVEAGSKRVEGIISLSDIFKFLLS